ncbi:MAG TPA: hypothetical protein VL137_10105 [Polyangiaceae bacterium]|jgi:uncharacterized protein (DUF4415 family)|nr:hypothetical protein [Polyangiaceae bacterium]
MNKRKNKKATRTTKSQKASQASKIPSARTSRSPSTRIEIALDPDVFSWFQTQVIAAKTGNFDDAINEALRGFIDSQQEALQRAVRKIVRDELRQLKR